MLEEIIRVCQDFRKETSDPTDKDRIFAIQRGLIPIIVAKEVQINAFNVSIRDFISNIYDRFPKSIKNPSNLETEECRRTILKIMKNINY